MQRGESCCAKVAIAQRVQSRGHCKGKHTLRKRPRTKERRPSSADRAWRSTNPRNTKGKTKAAEEPISQGRLSERTSKERQLEMNVFRSFLSPGRCASGVPRRGPTFLTIFPQKLNSG